MTSGLSQQADPSIMPQHDAEENTYMLFETIPKRTLNLECNLELFQKIIQNIKTNTFIFISEL